MSPLSPVGRLFALVLFALGTAQTASAQTTLAHLITGHVRATAQAPLGWTETIEGTLTLRREREDDLFYTYVLDRAELEWSVSGPAGDGCTASGREQFVETDPQSATLFVSRTTTGYAGNGSVPNRTFAFEVHVDCPPPLDDFDALRGLGTFLAVPPGAFEYVEIGLTDFRWLFAGERGAGTWEDPQVVWILESEALPTAGEADPDGASVRLVGPNPVRGALRVGVALGAATDARVEAFDALGRRVGVLHDGPLAAGTHAMSLEARLPAGVYVVRLTAAGGTASRRVTVAR